MDLARYKITHAYFGPAFHGWQRQGELPTIQWCLEQALRVFSSSELKKGTLLEEFPIAVYGSGRTDAGVHAEGQVAHFDFPRKAEISARRLRDALDALTPDGIKVVEVEEVQPEFDARHNAHVKRYDYRIFLGVRSGGPWRERAWFASARPLALEPMIEAAHLLKGQHDFSAFRASDCTASSTVRTVLASEVYRDSPMEIVYTACGKGFLKNMIRIIAGTLVDVGTGKMTVEQVGQLLEGGSRENAGETAPPYGLTLKSVRYLD